MIQDKLIELGACEEARDWATGKSIEEIWNTCHRGDWMLWLFKRTNPDDLRVLTLAKAKCALTVRHLMKDQRSIDACEIAVRFGEGTATREELDAAADDAAYPNAYADADSAAASAASAAADAYAYAASAASAAAESAAASAANAPDARKKSQQETADICRKYLPIPTI